MQRSERFSSLLAASLQPQQEHPRSPSQGACVALPCSTAMLCLPCIPVVASLLPPTQSQHRPPHLWLLVFIRQSIVGVTYVGLPRTVEASTLAAHDLQRHRGRVLPLKRLLPVQQ